MDDFRRVFPVTGTALCMDVPLKSRENETVVGQINMFGNLVPSRQWTCVTITERKPYRRSSFREDFIINIDNAIGSRESTDSLAILHDSDRFTVFFNKCSVS